MSNVACALLVFTFSWYMILDIDGSKMDAEKKPVPYLNFWGSTILPLMTLGLSRALFFLTSNGPIINVLVKEEALGAAYGIHYAA